MDVRSTLSKVDRQLDPPIINRVCLFAMHFAPRRKLPLHTPQTVLLLLPSL
jgi:hypothetical protein